MAPSSVNDMVFGTGKELYKNELFADAEVVVGGETWPIHKAIVCTRSDWFRKALAGSFKEATSNKVDLSDHDPKHVGLILRYLYTGEVPNYNVLPSLRECVDFIATSDYFAIEKLFSEVVKHFDIHLSCLKYRINNNEPLLSDENLEGFFYAAQFAYTSGPNFEVVRKPIESFISRSELLLARDSRFMSQLKNIPDLAEAMIRGMLPPETRDAIPEECASCYKKLDDLSDFAETWPARTPDSRCENCRESYSCRGRGRGRGIGRGGLSGRGGRGGRGGSGCTRDEPCSTVAGYIFEVRGHCHKCFRMQKPKQKVWGPYLIND